VKKWTKYNRRFLNFPKSNCLGAVSWEVSCYASRGFDYELDKPKDEPKKYRWSGSLSINKEAMDHFCTRKGELHAVYAMRTELNKFIAAAEQAIDNKREWNAKIKDTT
jgi:hypothetical protein